MTSRHPSAAVGGALLWFVSDNLEVLTRRSAGGVTVRRIIFSDPDSGGSKEL